MQCSKFNCHNDSCSLNVKLQILICYNFIYWNIIQQAFKFRCDNSTWCSVSQSLIFLNWNFEKNWGALHSPKQANNLISIFVRIFLLLFRYSEIYNASCFPKTKPQYRGTLDSLWIQFAMNSLDNNECLLSFAYKQWAQSYPATNTKIPYGHEDGFCVKFYEYINYSSVNVFLPIRACQ